MTQKKFLQIAGIVVGAVWIFCITFAIAYKLQNPSLGTDILVTNPPATTTTTAYVNTPSPSQPSTNSIFGVSPTTANLQGMTTAGIPTTTAPTTQASNVPQDKGEIINAYINGVNLLKNTQNFSMNKNDTLNVTITDVQMTGGAALQSAVMAFANNLIAPPAPESYTFVGGVDAVTGETPNSTIAPLNTAAQVDINAVTNATASPTADGGYTVTLTIQAESQNLYTPAPNLSTMVEIIDVQTLLPSGATLSESTVNYQPSTVSATFDSQNRIVAMEHRLASQGGGTGKMIVEVTMQMEGTYTSNYTITYN